MTPSERVEKLKEVRNLLSDPKRWTKGAYGRIRATMAPTGPVGTNADCWCMWGAILKVSGHDNLSNPDVMEIGGMMQEVLPEGIVDFNDDPNTKHSDLINKIDLAIKEAESHV